MVTSYDKSSYYMHLFFMFQCIDKSRDILDTELTAMAGESYDRAYGVSYKTVCSRPRWLSWMRVRLEIRRSQVRPPPRSATFFRRD